ncbi:hypothetical protein [uncultured Sulfitobacter sp.]|uniref:hypothetical protein n=1 Tax=uncultured Sulfitobacter sp. TaxID=191468 RepID=UPI0026020813|nr:hypothetical protein [uncultured Sulfitobacter sp.]
MQKYSKILYLFDLNGAPEGNKLEPFSAPELLQELENWTEVLKSEPEVIHRLAAFADASEGSIDTLDDAPDVPATWEPSP